MQIETTREDRRIAWLAALAVAIHVAEAALPSPLPGLKPGLANVITVAVLVRFGWATAAWVSFLRVLAGSLLLGTFLSPAFMLSFTGTLSAVLMLALASRMPGAGFGPVGYSLLAALSHMGGQFLCAYLVFIPHSGLLLLFPVLMTASLLFGIASGIIALRLVRALPAAA